MINEEPEDENMAEEAWDEKLKRVETQEGEHYEDTRVKKDKSPDKKKKKGKGKIQDYNLSEKLKDLPLIKKPIYRSILSWTEF